MSKKDLSGLFVNDVKIPRHDRDLLVSYMKLLDIANVDYTVDVKNDEYNMTLHTEPTNQGGKITTGTIKTDKVSNYDDVYGITSLNENVAKAISNIESLSLDSAKIGNIANIGITSAKIKNLPDLESIANKKIGTNTDKPKEKSRHYFRVFTLNNEDYCHKVPAPGYGKATDGRASDIAKGEYLRAFEIFISMNNISEVTYKNRTFIRVKVREVYYYFERIESIGGIVFKNASLELFEEAFSERAFMKKASNRTLLNETI